MEEWVFGLQELREIHTLNDMRPERQHQASSFPSRQDADVSMLTYEKVSLLTWLQATRLGRIGSTSPLDISAKVRQVGAAGSGQGQRPGQEARGDGRLLISIDVQPLKGGCHPLEPAGDLGPSRRLYDSGFRVGRV